MTGNIGRPGHRRQLDHRPVQRDGLAAVQQHDEPARAAATSPTPTHRAEVGRRPRHRRGAHPDAAELGLRPDHRGHPRAARSRACGSSPPTRRTRGSTRPSCASCSGGSTSSSCRTCTTDRDGRSAPTSSCRRPAGARRRGRSSTPSGGSALIKKVPRAPGAGAGRLPHLQAGRRRLGLRRHVRTSGDARGGLPDPQAAVGAASPATSPASPTTPTLDEAGGIQWPLLRRRRAIAGPGPTQRRLFDDGRFFHADGRARFVFENPRRCPSRPTTPLSRSSLLTGRGSVEPVAHADADGEVGRAARKLYPRADLRRDRPGRRARPRHRARANGSSSSRGAAAIAGARLRHARRCPAGQVFLPMHDAATNRLTLPGLRPLLAPALLQGLRRRRPPPAPLGTLTRRTGRGCATVRRWPPPSGRPR